MAKQIHTAGIYPARPANSLNTEEWERLAAAIPERISYFIEVNKITPEDYLETKGQDYRNTPFLQVYGQEGKPCPKCGEMLCRMVVGGRGSVICNLRKKIEPDSKNPTYIKTVLGVGYKFEVENTGKVAVM